MGNKRTLKDIAESIRDAYECYADFMVGRYIEDIESLVQPPDPPQVHIPGLDQTEWNG